MPTTDEYIYWKNWVEQLQAETKALQAVKSERDALVRERDHLRLELNRRREEIRILQVNLERFQTDLLGDQDDDSEVQAILAERKVWSDRLIEITRERDKLRAELQTVLEQDVRPRATTLADLIAQYMAVWEQLRRELERHPRGVMAGKECFWLGPDGALLATTPDLAESIQFNPIN